MFNSVLDVLWSLDKGKIEMCLLDLMKKLLAVIKEYSDFI